MFRSRREKLEYDRYRKTLKGGECSFCELTKQRSLIRETKHFCVVKNIFPYSLWDYCRVTDHVMIVPKRHIVTLAKLTDGEKAEYVDLVQSLEESGYNIYARPADSNIKTVPHLHTHGIKTDNRRVRLLLFLSRPYLRIIW